jgi:hypothetical protein
VLSSLGVDNENGLATAATHLVDMIFKSLNKDNL